MVHLARIILTKLCKQKINCDLVVDPYTVAKEGKVRLVVNAYFDAKVLVPTAIAVAKVKE